MKNFILSGLILSGSILGTLFLNSPVNAATCEHLFRGTSNNETVALARIARNVDAYRKSVNAQILEREFVIEPFLISLVAREHMLLIGPPGNAKTTLAKLLMTSIVDRDTGRPSFFSMQMHKEITLSDTHGGLDFGKLSQGAVERQYHEGMLGAKLGFMDEAFDVRAGALRNSLDVLAERAHSQGTQHHKGKTQTVIAATNKTLGEVYEDFNNSEQPRAFTDRFAFVMFVPKEMNSRESDLLIFKGANTAKPPIHKLEFQDIDVITSLAEKVDTPDYISDLASIIHYRLSPEFEAREVKSMQLYQEAVQNGKYALPPYRAAKYLSPRTLAKAGTVLRAIVALDYVAKHGNRSLTATIDDLSKLKTFYQLNGPSDRVLETQLSRAIKDFEKDQIASVKIDRGIVNPLFESTIKEFNEALGQMKLHEIDQAVREFSTLGPDARRRLSDRMKVLYLTSLATMQLELKTDITAETIASNAAHAIVKDYVEQLWPGRSEKITKNWVAEIGIDEAALTHKRRNKRERRLKSHAETASRQQGRLPKDIKPSAPTSAPLAAPTAKTSSPNPVKPSPTEPQKPAEAIQPAVLETRQFFSWNAQGNFSVDLTRLAASDSRLDGIVANNSGETFITTSANLLAFSKQNTFALQGDQFERHVPFGESILTISKNGEVFTSSSSQKFFKFNRFSTTNVTSDGQTVYIIASDKIYFSTGGDFAYFGEAPANTKAISTIPGTSDSVAVVFESGGRSYVAGIRKGERRLAEAPIHLNASLSQSAQFKMISDDRGFIIDNGEVTAFILRNEQGHDDWRYNSFPLSETSISISANGRRVAYVSNEALEIYDATVFHDRILNIAPRSTPPLVKINHDTSNVSATAISGDGSTLFLYDTKSILKYKIKLPLDAEDMSRELNLGIQTSTPGGSLAADVTRIAAPVSGSDGISSGITSNFSGESFVTTWNSGVAGPSGKLFSLMDNEVAQYVPFGDSIMATGVFGDLYTFHPSRKKWSKSKIESGPSLLASDGNTAYIAQSNKVLISKDGNSSTFSEASANITAISTVPEKPDQVVIVYRLNSSSYLQILTKDPATTGTKTIPFLDVETTNSTGLRMIDEHSGLIIGQDKITAFRLSKIPGEHPTALTSRPLEDGEFIAMSADGSRVVVGDSSEFHVYRATDFRDSFLEGSQREPLIELAFDLPDVAAVTISGDGSTVFLSDKKTILKFKLRTQPSEPASSESSDNGAD